MKFTKEKQEQGGELMQALVEKAWESAAFKDQLLSNPEIAIESVIGKTIAIPEGKKIIVEDQTDSNIIYLNIPQQVNTNDFELSDEQLESVSGGIAPLVILAWVGGVAAGAQIIDWVGQGWNSVH